jgi:hypothetical protein
MPVGTNGARASTARYSLYLLYSYKLQQQKTDAEWGTNGARASTARCSLYLLYWYSTKTDAEDATSAYRHPSRSRATLYLASFFTCFTGTKVPKLTRKTLLALTYTRPVHALTSG